MYDEKTADVAFRAFLKWIGMDFVTDDRHNYDVRYDKIDDKYVVTEDGIVVDERGELFMSIQNVFCAMYPNAQCRSAPYIFNNIDSLKERVQEVT